MLNFQAFFMEDLWTRDLRIMHRLKVFCVVSDIVIGLYGLA